MTEQQQALVRSLRYRLHKARQALKKLHGKANEVDASWASHNLWRAEQEAS